MSKIRVFVSFDTQHDTQLYDLLLTQSKMRGADFAILGASEGSISTAAASERARRRIREAAQVIVICGEHTKASKSVGAELHIAQEEETPYLLLWGRREVMCTKPPGSTHADRIYTWTPQTLSEQLAIALREARKDSRAENPRGAARKKSNPPGVAT